MYEQRERGKNSEGNAVIEGSSENIRAANNVTERWGCWADQTGSSVIKMYVGGFNQSKMANSSRADYKGTVLVDTVFVFL